MPCRGLVEKFAQLTTLGFGFPAQQALLLGSLAAHRRT